MLKMLNWHQRNALAADIVAPDAFMLVSRLPYAEIYVPKEHQYELRYQPLFRADFAESLVFEAVTAQKDFLSLYVPGGLEHKIGLFSKESHRYVFSQEIQRDDQSYIVHVLLVENWGVRCAITL